MRSQRNLFLALSLFFGMTLISACVPSMLGKQPAQDIKEQLYIDARLDFAIKHPLDWQRLKIPVSSPKYRADTVRWQVKYLGKLNHGNGEMLIQSRLADPEKSLENLLSAYLSNRPELKSSKVENFKHPAGPALKLLAHDEKQGMLVIALKGQHRDFIVALDYPSNRFDELLPIFQDIVNSFVEIVRPETKEEQ
ncbi:MAG: hypothetical protein GQ578_02345 [Desulfuromonadaceae bacterium]|nr:hypothetical protein [Desulfuromonadaceae bacterium]